MINSSRIKNRLKELSIRQKDVALELGLRQSSFNLKINNRRPMTLDEAEKIADILKIPDEEFSVYFFAKEVA